MMLVTVAENVVRAVAGTPDARMLHSVLAHACTGKHVVLFDPPDCANEWLASVDDGTRSAYLHALEFSTRDAALHSHDAATLRIDQQEATAWGDPLATLPLNDSIRVLDQALAVLLEDNENDWNFLLAIMPQSQRERAMEAKKEGWVVPLHGGGTGIKRQLQERLSQPHQKLRTFMMFDSDRLHPDELLPSWHPNQIPEGKRNCDAWDWEETAKNELPNRFWRLQRRFIESYMPKPELKDAVPEGNQDKLDAYWRMSRDQRWYFHIKKGFAQDKQHMQRQGNLYGSISEADRAVLQIGFGNKVANHYKYGHERDFAWDADALVEARMRLPKFLRLF